MDNTDYFSYKNIYLTNEELQNIVRCVIDFVSSEKYNILKNLHLLKIKQIIKDAEGHTINNEK